MDLGLKNKRALLLGSSRGLGLGIAKRLIQEGAEVAITGRNIEQLRQLADMLKTKSQARIIPLRVDLSEKGSVQSLFEAFIQEFGGIDILVNNSGGPPATLAIETTVEQWQEYFSTMFLQLIELTNLCIRMMSQQKWGRILTIGSSNVVQPIQGLAISNVFRISMVAWSKTLSTEVAKEGITVNTIVPGKILTERLESLNQAFAKKNNQSTEAFEKELLNTIPIGRFGRIEELADVAAFYLSECASYLTGSCIRVDGGCISSI